jgi:hypothetical protein
MMRIERLSGSCRGRLSRTLLEVGGMSNARKMRKCGKEDNNRWMQWREQNQNQRWKQEWNTMAGSFAIAGVRSGGSTFFYPFSLFPLSYFT